MEQALEMVSVILHGDCPALQCILDEGGGGMADEEGSTPLIYAAANNRDKMIRLLLQPKYGVDINEQNVYGWTALMQAACYGHLPPVVLLLQNEASVNVQNSWGATALVGAAQGGFITVAQVLLDKGAEVNTRDEVTAVTPLMAASQCGHADVVTELLKAGSKVNASLKATGVTALMVAALNNQVEVVKLLLGNGADQEMADINGRTAAELAAAMGCSEVVSLLVKEKPKVYTDTDIFGAAKAGDVDFVRELLRYKASLASLRDGDGATPLIFAANRGHREVCQLLLDAGADVNVKDKVHGWTAIMQATHQRRHEIVCLLGEKGARVDIRGKSGSTAFDIANMIGDIEMIRVIAGISMECIQRKRSSVEAPPSSLNSEPTPPSPTENRTSPVRPAEVQLEAIAEDPTPTGVGSKRNMAGVGVDPQELAKQLQKAYRTPETPTLELPNASESTPSANKSAFPMPMGRVRSHTKHPTSGSAFDSSPGSFPFPTPSSRATLFGDPQSPRLLSRPAIGDQQFLRPSSQPKFLSKSGSDTTRPTGIRLGALQLNKHPIVSPQNSSKFTVGPGRGGREERELPSFLQKYPGVARDLSRSRMRSRDGSPTQASLQRPVGQRKINPEGRLRERSMTDPLGQPRRKTTPTSAFRRGGSLNQGHQSTDIKSILEGASLGKYHPLFQEQEFDLHSFLVLSEQDLVELGISSSDDRFKLLSLITKLNAQPPTPKSGASDLSSPQTPVFVFQ